MEQNISEKLIEVIDAVVSEAGLMLFDIEVPKSSHGVFRIFISKDLAGKAAVGIEDCIKVSKKLSQREDFETLLPGSTLEVSSPGINRRLRRAEHFAGAVGERVRLTLATGETREVLVGSLRQFDGNNLILDQETTGEQLTLPIAQVRDARVEFLFT